MSLYSRSLAFSHFSYEWCDLLASCRWCVYWCLVSTVLGHWVSETWCVSFMRKLLLWACSLPSSLNRTLISPSPIKHPGSNLHTWQPSGLTVAQTALWSHPISSHSGDTHIMLYQTQCDPRHFSDIVWLPSEHIPTQSILYKSASFNSAKSIIKSTSQPTNQSINKPINQSTS